MQVMEYQKKKGMFSKEYALGINISTDGADQLAEQFRHVAEEILGWHNLRGKACGEVLFTILCAKDHHPEIKDFLEKVYLHETNIGPLFQKWNINVSLLSENGKPVEDYVLAPETIA